MNTNLIASLLVSTTLVLVSAGTVVALPGTIANASAGTAAVISWR